MGVLPAGEHILTLIFYIVWKGYSQRKVDWLFGWLILNQLVNAFIQA